jgi:hypothetical protein
VALNFCKLHVPGDISVQVSTVVLVQKLPFGFYTVYCVLFLRIVGTKHSTRGYMLLVARLGGVHGCAP